LTTFKFYCLSVVRRDSTEKAEIAVQTIKSSINKNTYRKKTNICGILNIIVVVVIVILNIFTNTIFTTGRKISRVKTLVHNEKVGVVTRHY